MYAFNGPGEKGKKKLFERIEDGWYNALDSLQTKGLPVYTIVDPIDKLLPSVLLFLAVVLALIAGTVFFVWGPLMGQLLPGIVGPDTGEKAISFKALTVKATDKESGAPVSGAEIKLDFKGTIRQASTDVLGLAELNAPDVSELKVKGIKTGYADFEETINIEGKNEIEIQLSREQQEAIKKTIRLVANGELVQGKELLVKFSCSTGVQAPEPVRTETGIAEVMQPENCGQLSASVESNAFASMQSTLLLAGASIISLTERIIPKGKVIVLVKSDEEEFLDNIQVSAFNEQNIPVGIKYSVNGETSFNLDLGKYYFSAEDVAIKAFITESSELIEVKEKDVNELTLVLTKQAIGSIKAKVIDKTTKQPVVNVAVQLKKKTGQGIESKQSTADWIDFRVKNDLEYVLFVDHNAYLSASVNASLSDNNKVIELERLSTENSGILEVSVIDEFQKPVDGARLSLFNADTNLLYDASEKLTDFNGVARFYGVGKGNYYVFGFKGLSSATGPILSIVDPKGIKKVGLLLEVGMVTVKLKIKDFEGQAVKFANITVFDVLGAKVRDDLTNDKGEKEISLKANREVFFRIQATGFVPFTSKPFQLNKNQARNLDAVLEAKPAELKLEFEGIYSEDGGKLAETIIAGETVEARFKLKISKPFQKVNVFFRLGDKELVDLEQAFIKEVKAAEFNELSRHSSYSLNKAVDDLNSVTPGEAKWARASFNDLNESVRQLAVFFRVREGALTGEQVKLYYRVEGVKGFGTASMTVERQPFDEALGTNASAAERHGLYALSNAFIMFIGKKADCTKEFCYSSSLLDTQAGLYLLEKPFETQLYGNYKLEVEISNISNKRFSEASLRIKSKEKGLQINSSKIVYEGSSESDPAPSNKFELPSFELGSFDPGELIRIELDLQTIKAQANNMEFRIVSEKKIAFEKKEGIRVGALDELIVDFEPKTIVPLIENSISITALDKKTELPVKDAVIILEKDFSGEVILGSTNQEGVLQIVLPASNPGSKLFIEARKYNYKSERTKLPLDEKFIELPSELAFSLNAKTQADDSKKIDLKNKSKLGLNLTGLTFNALSGRYLDIQKMQNYLLRYAQPPKAFPAEETTLIELIASLNADGKALLARQQIKGELLFDFGYAGHSWPFSLPVNAGIGLEGDVPEGCFSSDLSSWVDATEGTPASKLGDLRNDCFIQGKEVTLKEVTGSIKWKSNIRGKFSIEVDGVQTDLEPFREKTLLNNLEPGEHLMKLIYVPEPGMQGEKADADILLTAINPSGGLGLDQKLKHSIRASISVDNVSECIKPKTMSLKMNEGLNESAALEISSECAGAVEVKIEGPLRPERHSVVFSPGETKTIAITSDDEKGMDPCTEGACPGIYPVKIYAKSTKSKGAFKFIAEVPARIQSTSDFKLSRYEFDLFGTLDIESAYLSNEKLTDDETASITITPEEEDLWEKIKNVVIAVVIIIVLSFVIAAFSPLLVVDYQALAFWVSTTSAYISITASQMVPKTAGSYTATYTVERVNLDETLELSMDKGIIGDKKTGVSVAKEESLKEKRPDVKYLSQVKRLAFNKTEDLNEGIQYRLLKLGLNWKGYKTNYEWETDDTPLVPCNSESMLCRDSAKDDSMNEFFHLKFNTKKATERIETGSDLLAADCIGPNYKIGKTGEGALPRVKFGWNWTDIEWNACDEGRGQNYCDATQFSIEVLKKIRMLESFLEKNDFSCPTELMLEKLRNEMLNRVQRTIESGDIGISNVQAFATVKGKPVQAMAVIQNKNNKSLEFDLNVSILDSTNAIKETKGIHESVEAFGSKLVTVTLDEQGTLPVGYYAADFLLKPDLTNCVNCDDVNTNRQLTIFDISEPTPEMIAGKCTVPKNSGLLAAWIEATEAEGKTVSYDISGMDGVPVTVTSETIKGLADLHNLIGFNAYLIKDGYTVDFKKDFDSFFKEKTFFDTPTFYLGGGENPGLSKLFTSNSFRFTPVYNKDLLFYELPGAGLYHVALEVIFKGNDWAFFEGGEPKVDVVVSMEKVQSTDLKSPFYYLPLNGNIGVEGGKVSRQGYGVDYAGDYISVSKSELGLNTTVGASPKDIVSVNVSDSNPVARLETSVVQNVGALNQAYGTVMVLEEQQGKMKLRFSPSKPNPLIMKLRNEVGGAYAFYQLLKQGIPVDAGHSLVKWNGVGVNCKDFDGSIATEVFERGDIKGLNAQCVSSPSFNDSTVYGMEYCESSASGNMFYKTILYTPETQENFVLKKVAADSVARFYTPNKPTELEQVALDGLTGFNKKDYDYGLNIDSLQEVFDLVNEGMLCVNQNDVRAEFWWNPKYVYEFEVGETIETKKSINSLQQALLSSEGCIPLE